MLRSPNNTFILALIFGIFPILCDAEPVDLVVYGGTPAGIASAVVAAREGLSVTLIEPTKWVGGMVASGLSRTDKGREETIGGFAQEFLMRAAAIKPDTPLWYAEPHVNLETFQTMLQSAGVRVITDQALKCVEKRRPRIVSITTVDEILHQARVFIDASYEGDLMAAAKVSYTVERESREQYGESLAGYHPMPIRPRTAEVIASLSPSLDGSGPSYIHGTPISIPGRDEDGNPLYGVFANPGLELGAADHRTQSYNFRLCVTRRPGRFPRFRISDPLSRRPWAFCPCDSQPAAAFRRCQGQPLNPIGTANDHPNSSRTP